jgi:predicted MFS family arabinose efflux permease
MGQTPVVNRTTTLQIATPDPMQDLADPNPLVDSRRAWVSAAAVSVANGIGFGIAYTFGTFFDSMATEFGADKSATALIFGVTLLFFFGFGLVSGPLSDRYGPRPLLIAGGVIMVAGLLVTSRADSLALGIVSYGIGVGIGGGMFIAPMTSSIGPLFDRHRPAAFSLVAVGNGIGVLVLVPLSEWAIATHDWRWAYVMLAAIAGVGIALASFGLISRKGGGAAEQPSVRTLLAAPGFTLMFIVSLLMSIALFIAFAFIQTFAVEDGVSVSTAARLVSLVGLSSIFGRIGLVAMVRRLGAIWVIRTALITQVVAYCLWYLAGGDVGLLVAFVVLFGSAYGGFVAVIPEAVVRLIGLLGLGKSMGLLFFSFAVGGLIGPPLAGRGAAASPGHELPILLAVGLVTVAAMLSFRIRTGGLTTT